MNNKEVKLCECGCGNPAPISKYTQKSKGHVKGQPVRFVQGHNPSPSRPFVERFWEKVNKQGPLPSAEAVHVHPEIKGTLCWEWTACTSVDGYGYVSAGKSRLVTSHRAAWFIETGVWPKLCTCHKCDNPACVRFSHLFEATVGDNILDMCIKGRHSTILRRDEAGRIQGVQSAV